MTKATGVGRGGGGAGRRTRDLTLESPFDRLTVLAREPGSRWRVRCECGTEKVVQGSDLTSGKVRSCGCLLREASAARASARREDLTDREYGRLIVRRLEGEAWVAECACGGTWRGSATSLRNGSVRSCGCLLIESNRARNAARAADAQMRKMYGDLRVKMPPPELPDDWPYGRYAYDCMFGYIPFDDPRIAKLRDSADVEMWEFEFGGEP